MIMKKGLAGYNVLKAAQVSAFFAIKEGGEINVLKLTKLIYLSDRKHLEKYDTPILFDKLVSMDHGPVNSITYNYINGCLESPDWESLICSRKGTNIGIKNKQLSFDQLDQLSIAELEVLNSIWKEYGEMDRYQIRDFSHKYCNEWVDPEGSSLPISYKEILEALGKENCVMLAKAIEEERKIREL